MKFLMGVLCVAGLTLSILGQSSPKLPSLPVPVSEQRWQPLTDRVDARLQAQLEMRLRAQPGWSSLIRNSKLAVALVDLSEPERPRFAHVNGNTMMYAASLPKIAILLAAVDAVEAGHLVLDRQLDKDLSDMIRRSSNKAATRAIDRLGGLDKVNTVLKDPRFKFYDEETGGGLWVGRRYAKQSRRIPDPVNGISHGATATQVARFYYRMATGRIINFRASQRMLGYMVDPDIHHKFVNSLDREAPDARLYRKSGTWKQWHADSVLVWGPHWRRYILVGLVESEKGEDIIRTLVTVAEDSLQNKLAMQIPSEED